MRTSSFRAHGSRRCSLTLLSHAELSLSRELFAVVGLEVWFRSSIAPRSRRDRVSYGPSNHRFAVAYSKHPCQAPWWIRVRRDLKGHGRLELLQTREFITHHVMQYPRSTRVLPAPAGTFGAHHTSLAKPAFLQLPTLPAHDSDAVALLHQGPRGEESLIHSALDAEAFSLLGAEPAALGRCVFVCEVCAGRIWCRRNRRSRLLSGVEGRTALR
jgi:hypothetical protein